MMVDVTSIVDAVFNVILAISAVALAYLKSKSDKDAQIDAWVKIAVQAAEQAYKTGVTYDRKAYATKVLADKGLKLDWGQVDTMLEAAVNQLPPSTAVSDKGVIDSQDSQKGALQ